VLFRLPLTVGSFVLLIDEDGIQTCYNDADAGGTSRSAFCAPAAFIAWAEAAVARCRALTIPETSDAKTDTSGTSG